MTSEHRRRRGRETEHIAANHLRQLWPHCQPVNSFTTGPDLTETPGAAIEIKARRGLNLPGWLRQASKNAAGGLPILIIRGDGQGEATVGQWAAILPLDQLLALLKDAGYGDPP